MMRSLLLAGTIAAGLQVSAQCVPNQLYADSVYGVWPDTIENFAPGVVGVFYSDTLNILIPSDAGLINPLFSGFTLDSVALDNISGLPPGIEVTCNSQTAASCTYLPSQVGCGLLEGTPTQAGTFPITINITAFAYFFGVQTVDQAFGGYSITISASTGIAELHKDKLTGVRNVPNPFSDHTSFTFSLAKAAPVKINVFNLVGEELWNTSVQGKSGNNQVLLTMPALENGIYLYSVEAAGSSFTGRMVVNR